MVTFAVRSIKVEGDDLYQDDTVGRRFEDRLLAISNNDEAWEKRFKSLRENTNLVLSERFKRVMEEGPSKLQAVCHVAYLMKCDGKDAWRAPDNVSEKETEEYWKDVWKWCSTSEGNEQPPEDWFKREQ